LFFAALVIFLNEGMWSEGARQLGLPVFRAFLVILTVITLLFVPLYTGVRLAIERADSALDLMFITTLPAPRIVRGKLFCGAYVTALLFSVCTPFMALSNVLRGVDFPTIILILVCLYGVDCLAIQAAILLACLPFHQMFKIFLGILFALFLLVICLGLSIFFFTILREGAGAMLSSVRAWIGFSILLGLLWAGIQLFHGMSVALIIADNRPRGYFNEVIPEPTE
jgi:hypothetical protein